MTINEDNNDSQEMMKRWQQANRRGKIAGGFIIMAIGGLFLAKEMGAWIPEWVFSWQMLLITIGIYTGIKHSFHHMAWLVLISIGTIFMLKDYMPEIAITRYLWPVAIILFGFAILVKPKRNNLNKCRRYARRHGHKHFEAVGFSDGISSDTLEVNSVFGSVKKNILTKDFKGGEINVVFGGAEINLSQADFNGTIELEINQVFGGTRLIIPANWDLQSELSAVMGNVEDKRPTITVTSDNTEKKKLVLKGSVVFGGIEIQSYS